MLLEKHLHEKHGLEDIYLYLEYKYMILKVYNLKVSIVHKLYSLM